MMGLPLVSDNDAKMEDNEDEYTSDEDDYDIVEVRLCPTDLENHSHKFYRNEIPRKFISPVETSETEGWVNSI